MQQVAMLKFLETAHMLNIVMPHTFNLQGVGTVQQEMVITHRKTVMVTLQAQRMEQAEALPTISHSPIKSFITLGGLANSFEVVNRCIWLNVIVWLVVPVCRKFYIRYVFISGPGQPPRPSARPYINRIIPVVMRGHFPHG